MVIDEIIAYMLQKSPEGETLRSNNPFALVIPSETEFVRKAIWRAAQAELIAEYHCHITNRDGACWIGKAYSSFRRNDRG